jgi:hypothetical protein
LTRGSFSHVAYTYNATTRKCYLYINSAVVASRDATSGSFSYAAAPLGIGRRGDLDTTTDKFNGVIDEVAIYNRSLTADEISQHYQLSSQGFGYCAQICEPGVIESCYTGPAGTSGVGTCRNGSKTCNVYGVWNACIDQVTPSTENCNGLDEDCDGTPDNHLTLPACTKQSGVCAGAKQTCVAGGLQDCTDADYLAFNSSYAPLENNRTLCSDAKDNDCNAKCDTNGCTGYPAYDPNCDPANGGVTLPQCTVLDTLDLNGDGQVTINDAIWIIRKIVGYNDPTLVASNNPCAIMKVQ